MKTLLENRGNKNGVENNKFYELETRNGKLYCRWGTMSRYHDLRNQYTAQSGISILDESEYDSKLENKIKRGYVIITEGSSYVEDRPVENSNVIRKFGVEIETNTNLSKSELKKKLKNRGLAVKVTHSYQSSNGTTWDIKNDSSCGYEIASPILSGKTGIFDLKLATDKIKEALNDDHLPDLDCGIHITVDISDFSKIQIKRLIIGFLKSEHHFFKLCNESRQNNTYCEKYNITNTKLKKCINASTVSRITTILRVDKYCGLNLSKLDENVVEFRMFQSELNPRKITKWVRTCVGFVEGIKLSNVEFTTTSKLNETQFNSIIKEI